ncbi:MAG: hypothetical protein K2G25_09440 [Oscillospiraceae bacterium]|nr:hypothetical protein [Oscillospiraceae bacterium]
MMREMSYRDKMILVIMTAIIILAAGFFALIRPKYNKLVADRDDYEATKTEWEGIDAKLQQIPTLEENIKKEASEAEKTAELFVNSVFEPVNDTFDNLKANYILDQYVQPMIDECELEVSSFATSGIASQTLDYYYYTPNVLTYSLLENADINGKYEQQVSDLLKESNTLSQKETAEVMTNTLDLTVRGSRENLALFLDKIKEDENAIRVTSVDIADYTFGKGQTRMETVESTDEEGNVTTTQREVTDNGDGKSELTLSLTFYNAMPIDEPDFS